jgi:hypothetical protein
MYATLTTTTKNTAYRRRRKIDKLRRNHVENCEMSKCEGDKDL